MGANSVAQVEITSPDILANAVGGWHNIELTMKVHKGRREGGWPHSHHAAAAPLVAGSVHSSIWPFDESELAWIMELQERFCRLFNTLRKLSL